MWLTEKIDSQIVTSDAAKSQCAFKSSEFFMRNVHFNLSAWQLKIVDV